MIKKKELSIETENLTMKNINEEEREFIKWMRYPREFEARDLILKAYTDTGSHI